jgi:hypothetical protein
MNRVNGDYMEKQTCTRCGYDELQFVIINVLKDKNNENVGSVPLCINCFEALKAGKIDGTKYGIISSYIS